MGGFKMKVLLVINDNIDILKVLIDGEEKYTA